MNFATKLAARALLRVTANRWRQRLTILVYHRVLPERDALRPGEPDVAEFDWQMELVASAFNALPLGEAVSRLVKGRLPPRAAAVTFDDGYADNRSLALPVLERRGVPATVFVATGFLNGGCMFNDAVIEAVRRLPPGPVDLSPLGIEPYAAPASIVDDGDRRALIDMLLPHFKRASLERRSALLERLETWSQGAWPTDLMMSDEQVRELHTAGVEIGAHTVNHPILRQLSPEDSRTEIAQSKQYLEGVTGTPVTLFAYPNGRHGEDYDEIHVEQVRGLAFAGAVSTHAGAAGPASDPYQLQRFTPWDRTPARFAARLALNAW